MRHFKTAGPTPFCIALLALVTAACSDFSGPPSGEPEQPGVLLLPSVETVLYSDPVWTKDGSEIVFIKGFTTGASSTAIIAVNVSTHAMRQLHSAPIIQNLRRSNGDQWIYFEVVDVTPYGSTAPVLKRLNPSSGGVETVPATFPGYPDDVVIYADERFLVSASGFFNLQTSTRIDHAGGIPASFSPDGSRALFGMNINITSPASPTLVSTIDGSSQQLHSTDNFALAHRWVANTPQFLSTTNDYLAGIIRLYEIDGLSGTRSEIAQFTSNLAYIYASWAPDGQTLGAWIDEGDIGKGTDRTALYIIRPGSTPTIAVTVRPSWDAGGPSRPVFSPDSHSVAYFYPHPDDKVSLYLKTGI